MVNMKRIVPLLLLLLMGSLPAVEVSATLSTDSVAVGEGALLTVKVEDGRPSGDPVVPAVKDLIVNERGTSQNVQIINGAMTRSLSYNYVVGSQKEGEYEVPAIRVRVGGKDYSTKPMKLKVRAAANAKPQGMDDEEETRDEPGAYGHLALQMVESDRTHVYPGEIAPVRIRAFFPAEARVSLNGAPRPEGSAFTLHNLSDEPEQSSVTVDGKRYLVVTWFGGLSATKAGTYPATIKLDATVSVPDRSRSRRSPFDDPFFDDPFMGGSMFRNVFGQMVDKDVELTTDAENSEIEVIELPQDGRPENFTGAIGQFEFDSARLPSSLTTGEPFRIEAVLKGEGNFSLLSEPQPTPESEWKTYDGKSEFEGGDLASFAGKKAFRYSAVPLMPGEKEVALSFSYFDPDAGEYVEVQSQPQQVTITGEVVTKASPGKEAQPQNQVPAVPQLAPLAIEPGGVKSYFSLADEAWFVPVLALCGILTVGILGFGWWNGRAADLTKISHQELDRAAQAALSEAGKAASAGNAVAFFQAARQAMRLRVAEERGINPEAVTAADLDGVDDETIAGIFSEADRVDYSGQTIAKEDLTGWKNKLDEAMTALELNNKEKTT